MAEAIAENKRDLSARLNGTICLHKGVPVYVFIEELDPIEMVKIKPIEFTLSGSHKYKTVSYLDPDFSYKPFDLGFCNHPSLNDCVFTFRTGLRGTSQGLTTRTCMYSYPNNERIHRAENAIVYHKAFKNTILNKYPSIKECLEVLDTRRSKPVTLLDVEYDTNKRSMAFHRNFCLRRECHDYYDVWFTNRIRVGTMKRDNFYLIPGKKVTTIEKYLFGILDSHDIKRT